MEPNNALHTAWDFVEHTGHSIFLTGKAGTGKTTFLKTVVERSCKRPIVVAPTGVAAINAGGVTIHSFFQLPFTPYLPGAKMESKFDFGRDKRKVIASMDLLIIDEISMVRADLLDAVDSVLRRYRNHYQPFGGVQLLMIGDLAQLTPVVTPEDEKMLKPYYDTPYFFGAKALQQTDYVTIQLEHVYRQQDQHFVDILNHIRNGKPTADDLAALNSRIAPPPSLCPAVLSPGAAPTAPPVEGQIRLTTHNQQANYYNESELQRLPGRPMAYRAEVKGVFPNYSYPTAETLVVKVGAQVMFVKNDPTGNHRYYNGRIGRVTYADEQHLMVLCQGDEKAIDVEKLQWENTRYTLNAQTREIESEVQGTFQQYPLRLAWAITIHKSQGLTFDHAIIDANFSFAPGQVYVALSRCRTLQGLTLAAPLHQQAIITDARVDNYIARQEKEARQSIEQLPLLKQEYSRQLLLQLFDFTDIVAQQDTMVRIFAEYFYRSHASLTQLHNQALATLKQRVADVANKWRAKITAMTVGELYTDEFLDRVKRSADYFAKELADTLDKPIALSLKVETNNKQATKRLGYALTEIQQSYNAHHLLLKKVGRHGFTVETYLKDKQMAMLDALDQGGNSTGTKGRRQGTKSRKASTTTEDQKPPKPKTWAVSYDLYRQGKTIDQIAHERNITPDTVSSHLARYVSAGDIPIEALVKNDHLEAISRVVARIGTNDGSTAIKNLCPPEVTYNEIRLFLAAMKQ